MCCIVEQQSKHGKKFRLAGELDMSYSVIYQSYSSITAYLGSACKL